MWPYARGVWTAAASAAEIRAPAKVTRTAALTRMNEDDISIVTAGGTAADRAERLTRTLRDQSFPNVKPRDAATLILIDRAEPVPKVLMLAALPFGCVFVRAAWRASRSLALPQTNVTLATVGLFRPRTICAPQFAASLDEGALAAAMEHERAHVRHRDPLRIWLAQFGTELLWPAPAAFARFNAWKRALEIARDDEARARGATGPDLAAAIVVALRFNQNGAPTSSANLAEEAFVRERIVRLLMPLEAQASTQPETGALLVVLSAAIPLAVVIGIKFGELLIGSLLTKA